MEIPDDMLANLIRDARTARRPKLETVLEIIDAAFTKMRVSVDRIEAGPTRWVWEDLEMRELGVPRQFIVSESSTPGLEGHPVLTIRQAFSVNFDIWVEMSTIILGPGPDEVGNSVSRAIVWHSGAFAGMKYVSTAVTANMSSPFAGMVAAARLLQAPPPTVSADDVEDLVSTVMGSVSKGDDASTDPTPGPKRMVN